MIDESQKPVTQSYRDNWDRIWGPKVGVDVARDVYLGDQGFEISGEDADRARLPGESARDAADRLYKAFLESR